MEKEKSTPHSVELFSLGIFRRKVKEYLLVHLSCIHYTKSPRPPTIYLPLITIWGTKVHIFSPYTFICTQHLLIYIVVCFSNTFDWTTRRFTFRRLHIDIYRKSFSPIPRGAATTAQDVILSREVGTQNPHQVWEFPLYFRRVSCLLWALKTNLERSSSLSYLYLECWRHDDSWDTPYSDSRVCKETPN